jgi:predicted house-cleaning noncanonical NTP pyrophosphatase (MazG superfamily)
LDNYNKLIRDKIPEIIENSGRKAKYHVLSKEEYLVALDKKLFEEVEEYQADKSLEEMADVLEVLYAICKARGYSVEELEGKRVEKSTLRGGFDKKLFLECAGEENPEDEVVRSWEN